MKRIHTLNTGLIAIGLIALQGCDSNTSNSQQSADTEQGTETHEERLVREWNDFTEQLANYTEEEKQQAVSAVESEIEDLNDRIAALETEIANTAETTSSEIQEAHQTTLDELKAQRDAVVFWSEKLKDNTAAAWSDIRDGLSDAYVSLEKSLQEAEQEFSEKKEQSSKGDNDATS